MKNKDLKKVILGLTRPKVQRGTVNAIDFDVIDVRVGSGLIRNVKVVGDVGQLKRGDEVELSWNEATRRPVAFVSTVIPDADPVVEEEFASNKRNVILLLGPDTEATFPISDKGLSDALGTSFDECVIYVPRGVIAGSFSLPEGVSLVGGGPGITRIIGTIEGGKTIRDLSILKADQEACAYHYTGGHTFLDNCELTAIGDMAFPIVLCGSGSLTVWNCNLSADGEQEVGINYQYGTLEVLVVGGRISADKVYSK